MPLSLWVLYGAFILWPLWYGEAFIRFGLIGLMYASCACSRHFRFWERIGSILGLTILMVCGQFLRNRGLRCLSQRLIIGFSQVRSNQLAEKLAKRWNDGGDIYVVAHSMGGLDARRVIARFQIGTCIKNSSPLQPPHYGSPVADAVLGKIPHYWP